MALCHRLWGSLQNRLFRKGPALWGRDAKTVHLYLWGCHTLDVFQVAGRIALINDCSE